jgi:hypothetical protein
VRRFTYKTWGGSTRTIESKRVEFHFGYVVFLGTVEDGYRVVLAERESNCNEIREVTPL